MLGVGTPLARTVLGLEPGVKDADDDGRNDNEYDDIGACHLDHSFE
jgi:hypothetical protein